MLTLDRDLPPGALLPQPPLAVTEAAAAAGGICYAPGGAELAGDGVARIVPSGAGEIAEPVEGNAGNLTLDGSGPTRRFQFRRRTACGFAAALPGAPASLSLAILFRAPEGPGGTLAAVTPVDGRDYTFLSHEDGAVSLSKRKAAAELRCPLPSALSATLVLAHAAGRNWALALNAGPIQRIGTAPEFAPGAYDLFIGCRRRRAGLHSALGAPQIFGVIALPDVNIFDDSASPLRDALHARRDEIARHGL